MALLKKHTAPIVEVFPPLETLPEAMAYYHGNEGNFDAQAICYGKNCYV